MNKELLKQIIEEQLKKYKLEDAIIYILDTKWGYVAQIDYQHENNKESYHALFDMNGNILSPFTKSIRSNGNDGVYILKEEELWDEMSKVHPLDRERKQKLFSKINKELEQLGDRQYVKYKELDENHFIIPSENMSHALFMVDENNNIHYKGKIDGIISQFNEMLAKEKLLLVRNNIDITKDEYEEFLYSWDKNCIVSDKWSNLIPPNNIMYARQRLAMIKNMPIEVINNIITYMQKNNACLTALKIMSRDGKNHMDFFSLIQMNGIPLIDLMYISNEYKVQVIKLQKEEAGEVDGIRKNLHDYVDRKIMEIEENRKKLIDNFSLLAGLPQQEFNELPDK